jgi:uncharacterized membrane protein YkvA (DUF1232 family)
MPALFPEGLTDNEFSLLTACSNEAAGLTPQVLLKQAFGHLEKVRHAHDQNAFVNLRLAEAMVDVFKTVVGQWDGLPDPAKPWLKGMIRYFALSTDLESDLTSPIGFDDDVAIMNACLRLAGLDDLCLDPEDFDDL